MLLNTIIQLPDGRIGTICYNHVDGPGGVWGEHEFEMLDGGFGDELPAPDFMLREKEIEKSLRGDGQFGGHKETMECVGINYEVLKIPGHRRIE